MIALYNQNLVKIDSNDSKMETGTYREFSRQKKRWSISNYDYVLVIYRYAAVPVSSQKIERSRAPRSVYSVIVNNITSGIRTFVLLKRKKKKGPAGNKFVSCYKAKSVISRIFAYLFAFFWLFDACLTRIHFFSGIFV